MHPPKEVVIKKRKLSKCPGILQGTKKWNELQSSGVCPEDIVDLTGDDELTPLNFDDEEAKLSRSLECLKKRYPKANCFMYRFFLISVALVEKFVAGSEYGVFHSEYNVCGENDEECVFCAQQLRGKVIIHKCECGVMNRFHIECFRCNLAYQFNEPKGPKTIRCLVCHDSLFGNHPVLSSI